MAVPQLEAPLYAEGVGAFKELRNAPSTQGGQAANNEFAHQVQPPWSGYGGTQSPEKEQPTPLKAYPPTAFPCAILAFHVAATLAATAFRELVHEMGESRHRGGIGIGLGSAHGALGRVSGVVTGSKGPARKEEHWRSARFDSPSRHSSFWIPCFLLAGPR